MDTLTLDLQSWDLTLDDSGNIAVSTGLYAQAQDAASELRLFKGELYYDTGRGVPYWQDILGHLPPVALMKAKFVQAALLVEGVVAAQCFIQSTEGRRVSGQVQLTNALNQTGIASF